MGRLVLVMGLALGLGGCAAAAVVGAAATVVGAGVKVAGSAVSATVDVVGAGVKGAIELATGDDDGDDGKAGATPERKRADAAISKEPPAAREVTSEAPFDRATEDRFEDTAWVGED